MKKFFMSFWAMALCLVYVANANADGFPVSWGNNNYGELGSGTYVDTRVPGRILTSGALAGKTVIALSGGQGFSLALTSEGRVYGWGGNDYGQLGNGGYDSSAVPVAVDTSGVLAGKTIVAISAGGNHSVVLSSDGHIYIWGWNGYGQSGEESPSENTRPILFDSGGVLNGKTVKAISAGLLHNLLLTTDGQVYGWGSRENGSIGAGPADGSFGLVPVATTGVLAGKTIIAISAGGYHSMALSSEGRVYTWGSNENGALGDGTYASKNVPVEIGTTGVLAGKTIKALDAGFLHSVVVTTDGRVYSWGGNGYGQLGDGTTVTRTAPVAVNVGGVLNGKVVSSISAGAYYNIALSSDGRCYNWGNNSLGELGDGRDYSISPVPVAVDTAGVLAGNTVSSVEAGWFHDLVLASDALPVGVSIAAPLNGSFSRTLAGISGTATDSQGGRDVVKVSLQLRRVNAGGSAEYWGLRDGVWKWAAPLVSFPAQYSAGKWRFANNAPAGSKLPAGADLAAGKYTVVAYAYGKVGNQANARNGFSIELTYPTKLTIATPVAGRTLSKLSIISGTAADNSGGSGLDRVTVTLRRTTNQGKTEYWGLHGLGYSWTTTPVSLPTTLDGSKWSVASYDPDGVYLPEDWQMSDGAHVVTAYAYDKAGNVATLARTFSVDHTLKISVTATEPLSGSVTNMAALSRIAGTVSNSNGREFSGAVTILLHRFRNGGHAYWGKRGTVWGWGSQSVSIPAAVKAGRWSLSQNVPAMTVLPKNEDLLDGFHYYAEITATDAAGNQGFGYTGFRIDRQAPTFLSIDQPYHGAALTELRTVSGNVSDGGDYPGAVRVELALGRAGAGGSPEYWGYREGAWGWGSVEAKIATSLSTSSSNYYSQWTAGPQTGAVMPSGEDLTDGAYFVVARAVDFAGNFTSVRNDFLIDQAGPASVTIATPQNGSTLRSLTSLSGTALDNPGGTGIKYVNLLLRRTSSGGLMEYWSRATGVWSWTHSYYTFPAVYVNGNWSVVADSPSGSVLPAGANLKTGDYSLFANANDLAGNQLVARSDFKIGTAVTAKASDQPVSTVALSAANAEAGPSSVTLSFTGALGQNAATEAARYNVQVNGTAVEVESVSLQGANTVVLGLPEGELHAGDAVTVIYDLRDTAGRSAGGTVTIKAK